MKSNRKLLLIFSQDEVRAHDGECLVAPLTEEDETVIDEMLKDITVEKTVGWCG